MIKSSNYQTTKSVHYFHRSMLKKKYTLGLRAHELVQWFGLMADQVRGKDRCTFSFISIMEKRLQYFLSEIRNFIHVAFILFQVRFAKVLDIHNAILYSNRMRTVTEKNYGYFVLPFLFYKRKSGVTDSSCWRIEREL